VKEPESPLKTDKPKEIDSSLKTEKLKESEEEKDPQMVAVMLNQHLFCLVSFPI
jgi:hypothetical protein